MKLLFLAVILLILTNSSLAQVSFTDSVNISRESWRDSTFRIDKSQIPTGILAEYSLFPFETSKYDGLYSDDDTIKTDGDFFMLHNTLSLSIVNTNASLLNTDTLYNRAINFYNTYNSIPFVFLYKPYNRIRETALTEGLFTIAADSVGILDVANRTTSPYDTYNVFAFSASKSFITQFNAIRFAFPASLWETGSITSVSINFDDGAGFRTINQNDSLSIYYATEGIKNITAHIVVGGTTLTAHSTITYARPSVFLQPSYQWSIDTTRIYGNEADYLGNTNTTFGTSGTASFNATTGANVTVENGCDNVFDKPIIIVEGFDIGDKISFDGLRYLFRDFSFISTLKAYGYDMVYVDFKDNKDYIENNARVLEAIINKINQVKTGTNKINVIGYSMGGLIARWCLKDMEDRSLTHNVDKYFSYDAPHQGANVQLGFQFFNKELLRDIPSLKWDNAGETITRPGLRDYDEAYDSPAALQMMVTKGSYYNAALNWNPNISTLNDLRAAFAARLVAKGYSQQTTNYGIAFGRGNNTSNSKDAGNGDQWGGFNAGDKIFRGSLTAILANFTTDIWSVAENNTNANVCNYHFIGFRLIRLFGCCAIPWPVPLRVRNFKYLGQYPLDDAPGSYVKTQIDAAYSFNANPIFSRFVQTDTYGHDGHNFVSTASALDLQNQSYGSTNAWQSANMFFNIDNYIQNPSGSNGGGSLSTPSLSPFAEVITSTSTNGASASNNQFHLSGINQRFAEFMLKKILGFAPDPVNCANDGFCDLNPTISGPSIVCSTGVFTINSLPSSITIKWESMHGSFRITNGQGTNQITISKNYNAADTLILSLTNSCGTTRVIKLGIQVGLLYSGFNISTYPFPEPECFELWSIHTFQATLAYGQNPTGWQWGYRIVGVTGDIIYPYNSEFFTLIPEQEGTYEIFVRPLNDCGPGFPETIKTITVSSACAGSFGRFAASPNPTSGDVQIETLTTAKTTTIKEIQVTDKYGNIKKTIKLNTSPKKHKISIADLPADVYIIRIYDGKTWVSKKVIKS